MLIGLLSDTHIPDHARELPEQLQEVFHGVDLILHGGDIYETSVLDELERIAPVLAAQGDDDVLSAVSDKRVQWEHMLLFEGVSIWLKHILWWQPDQFMRQIDPSNPKYEEPPDVIVYGHTHRASLKNHGSVIMINPGSVTFPYYRRGELGTVGLLKVNSGKAEAEIIQLK
ncbi:metallophosphoesterase family protein [Chloroflexota bacterium]